MVTARAVTNETGNVLTTHFHIEDIHSNPHDPWGTKVTKITTGLLTQYIHLDGAVGILAAHIDRTISSTFGVRCTVYKTTRGARIALKTKEYAIVGGVIYERHI